MNSNASRSTISRIDSQVGKQHQPRRIALGTISIFSDSIRPTTDSSYGDTGSKKNSTSAIDFAYYFSPIAPDLLKMQNTAKKGTNYEKT